MTNTQNASNRRKSMNFERASKIISEIIQEKEFELDNLQRKLDVREREGKPESNWHIRLETSKEALEEEIEALKYVTEQAFNFTMEEAAI